MPGQEGPTAYQPRDLGREVIRGAGWMLGAQATVQVIGLVTSMLVARFLGPRSVGLAGMALVFGSLALVIVDFGFASALVQKPKLDDEDASTAFWAGLGLGIALTLAGIGLSWPIAHFYRQPEVQPLFAVLSLCFLFTAPGIVQGALLTRELRFRSLQVRTIIATSISCAVAIVLAALGSGPWAIVAQDLTITSVSTILLWRSSSWRPSWRVSRDSLRTIMRFGGNVFGARFTDWGAKNTDNLLVGRFLGASSLGAYSVAFNVVVSPAKRISIPLAEVFFPAFSVMRDPKRIAATWLRAVRMVAFAIVPLMLGVLALAPDFVRIVFGPKWHAAVPILQILAPVGLLQALSGMNASVLQAINRPGLLFRFIAVASITTISAFAVGLIWGLEGVAIAYLIVEAGLEPSFMVLTSRAIGRRPSDWVRSVSGVLEAGLGMLVAVLALRSFLLRTSLPLGIRFGICVVLGGLSYIGLVLWRAPEIKREFRVLRERRRGPIDAPEPRELTAAR